MGSNDLPEGGPHKQKGWEHLCTGLVLVAEFGAVKYSIVWLAWTAGLFLWFAVCNYARHYLGKRMAKIAMLAAIPIIIAGTHYLTREREKPATAQTPIPSTPDTTIASGPSAKVEHQQPEHKDQESATVSSSALKQSQSVKARSAKTSKNKAPEKPSAIQQDNSAHIGDGATVNQSANAPCSANIIGGGNTINCTPAPPPASVPTNSAIRNAGELGPIFVDKLKVYAVPNGNATILDQLPGGKSDLGKITIGEAEVGVPSSNALPSTHASLLGVGKNAGVDRFLAEGNTYCEEQPMVTNEGQIYNAIIRKNTPYNCTWVSFLYALKAYPDVLPINLQNWTDRMEEKWVDLSLDQKQKNRAELTRIKETLLANRDDPEKLNQAVNGLMPTPPSFQIPLECCIPH